MYTQPGNKMPLERISVSSAAFGSAPVFDRHGQLTRYEASSLDPCAQATNHFKPMQCIKDHCWVFQLRTQEQAPCMPLLMSEAWCFGVVTMILHAACSVRMKCSWVSNHISQSHQLTTSATENHGSPSGTVMPLILVLFLCPCP